MSGISGDSAILKYPRIERKRISKARRIGPTDYTKIGKTRPRVEDVLRKYSRRSDKYF